ncbi:MULTISPECIES: peptide-methionine (R)-S-oxide reductase MsrB [Cupriavidus]|uniref:peptide-methionine (R)-S-oxide reductase n=1 Tax=Cupriavidus pauculus TaxID=82633 RepID=A0A3G8H307_9BURK|nr:MULTISPECIES: peptide-methionine (R)-S-oxide reductase MsrB [Cupriavidus]AZG14746.1 peptide-methionine (R)-S-oxide reductase [Cupriavidus pauculus]MDT6962809.1 peptide-methionine (R)-S-oxide reductase MsrB [Cupriavidus sp. SZY C1]
MRITRRFLLSGGTLAAAVATVGGWRLLAGPAAVAATPGQAPARFDVTLSDAEWRRKLTPAQYNVLRQEGTERPYSSPLNDEHRKGVFACAGCQRDLFSSNTKFDSGTGWPSFWAPLAGAVGTTQDVSFGMIRTAVHCSRCGGHLGHVFDDGPKPTGQRYCMNGVAMTFRPVPA